LKASGCPLQGYDTPWAPGRVRVGPRTPGRVRVVDGQVGQIRLG